MLFPDIDEDKIVEIVKGGNVLAYRILNIEDGGKKLSIAYDKDPASLFGWVAEQGEEFGITRLDVVEAEDYSRRYGGTPWEVMTQKSGGVDADDLLGSIDGLAALLLDADLIWGGEQAGYTCE